ncbi:MAG: threonine dehydratase [Burkholderiales bacterium]|nr:threonine dehydratase [Burkholderiales bacterium]
MNELSLTALERAAALVHQVIPPTPQYSWPLLNARAGCELWVKHENHTPIGAFKVRGGLVLLDRLRSRPGFRGVISATRGNHGQSLAFAAARAGARCVILVPHGNSREKNAAMRALGAELVEHGRDFDEARERASALAAGEGLEYVGPFLPELVAGVASYALELFRGAAPLDAVYVPIGCGSGICGLIAARDALGLATRIIGVVSANANAYAQSFAARRAVETASAVTLADGMAVRVPVPAALEIIIRGAERIVEVTDAEVAAAMRHYFTDTHNVAEGAGAAPLAAVLQERGRWRGKRVGIILSGGNVDREVFARVLADASGGPLVE